MSHDQGRHQFRHKPARHVHDSEAFARPSLFAQGPGVDDDQAGMQGVQILATLESAQSPQRVTSTKKREQPLGHRSITRDAWQITALAGLMAAGILLLLTAFIMLLAERDATKAAQVTANTFPTPSKAEDRPAPDGSQNPLAALVTNPTMPEEVPAMRQQAALIEDMPSSTALAVSPSLAMPRAISEPSTAPAAAPVIAAHAQASNITKAALANSTLAGTTAASHRAADKPPATSGARSTKDDDVALLEAVMAHSASRKAAQP